MRTPEQGYHIAASTDETSLDLYIYEAIGGDWFGGVSAKQIVDDLIAHKLAGVINVYINSGGGSVFEAQTIHNALRRHRGTVVTHVDGAALSAASIVAMAGDTIHMAANALMMIHEPWAIWGGTAEELRKHAELLDKSKQTIAKVYANRTGKDETEIVAMMEAETWFTADEAVVAGFADKVTETKKLAAMAIPMPPGDRRFKHAPPQFETMSMAVVRPNDKTQPTTGELPMADQTVQPTTKADPTPATIVELQTALPDGEAEFYVECLSKNLTLGQAKDRHSALVVEKLKGAEAKIEATRIENQELRAEAQRRKVTSGAEPARFTAPDGSGAKDFLSVAAELREKRKCTWSEAQRLVAQTYPDLFRTYKDGLGVH